VLGKPVRDALAALREWARDSAFVQRYKYAVGVDRYTHDPHAVTRVTAASLDELGFTLGAALSLGRPVSRGELADRDRRIADLLVAGSLLREDAGVLRMGRFQLISAHGLPLLVDARVNFPGAANHEVYIGPDTGLLAYYVDLARLGGGPALDLGTGTAALPLALSNHAARVVATDIAPAPLELARMNIALAGREDRIELRDEPFATTFARGERFRTVTFNPPFVPLPLELAAPIFAKGTEVDGLGYCRQLFECFDELVAPDGAAYIVAGLVGDREQPFYVAELQRVAEQRRLCIDVFVDARNDFEAFPEQFALLGEFVHRDNPEVSAEECGRRIEHLQRVQLGGTCTHLTVIAARRATAVAPYCTLFNRFRTVAPGRLREAS
jgi:hypothetical protein